MWTILSIHLVDWNIKPSENFTQTNSIMASVRARRIQNRYGLPIPSGPCLLQLRWENANSSHSLTGWRRHAVPRTQNLISAAQTKTSIYSSRVRFVMSSFPPIVCACMDLINWLSEFLVSVRKSLEICHTISSITKRKHLVVELFNQQTRDHLRIK